MLDTAQGRNYSSVYLCDHTSPLHDVSILPTLRLISEDETDLIRRAMIALAIVGNYWVNKGMTNFLDGMTSFVDDVYNVANQTSSLLAEVGVSITDTVDQVSSLRRTYNQYKVAF